MNGCLEVLALHINNYTAFYIKLILKQNKLTVEQNWKDHIKLRNLNCLGK